MSRGKTGITSGPSCFFFFARKSRSAMLVVEAGWVIELARIKGAVEDLDHLFGPQGLRTHARSGETARDQIQAFGKLQARLLEVSILGCCSIALLAAEDVERARDPFSNLDVPRRHVRNHDIKTLGHDVGLLSE